MKKLTIVILLFLLLSLLGAQARIVSSKSGKDINIKTLGKELRKYDIIFFGEQHGNPTIHDLQKAVLPHLLQRKRPLILSFEMWERDTQDVLDAYLAGETTEEMFIEASRAWSNYASSYRPLISFAKEHKLPAIAANVPREYAGRTARNGWDFVDTLPLEERKWIAQELTAPKDKYREEFMLTMLGMGGEHFSENNLENYYKAQCMKDDTMAESIVTALENHKNARVIHFNGVFHSQEFLGTVSRVRAALPKAKIAVITPVADDDWQSLKADKSLKALGTHLILIPPYNEGEQE
jgi:uncharacterized iron-regulated protein